MPPGQYSIVIRVQSLESRPSYSVCVTLGKASDLSLPPFQPRNKKEKEIKIGPTRSFLGGLSNKSSPLLLTYYVAVFGLNALLNSANRNNNPLGQTIFYPQWTAAEIETQIGYFV